MRDLGSRNGTIANGIAIVDGLVPGGTVLMLGGTTVRIEVDAQSTEVPIPARTSFGALVGTSER
ncbi:MAG TPA: hypothetical protein VGC41_03260, partial [Kofleriaceae bacterium]